MNRLTPSFCSEFRTHMEQETRMSGNEFMAGGFVVLSKHKLLKVAQKVHPKLIMTHMENRNRLMLNPPNVHKKGAVIYSIGANRSQLSAAVGVELDPSGPSRLQNIDANVKLIDKSKNLLAPLNGLGCPGAHIVKQMNNKSYECMKIYTHFIFLYHIVYCI